VKIIAAQGDSWFDYPGADVLERLETLHGYEVASCAHRGDTIESMAYDETQGRKLARLFLGLASGGREPEAVLVSAGGNDIAGDELALLLNHRASPLPAVNEDVLRGVLERIATAYRSLLFGITGLCRAFFGRQVPIVVHGYGYAVPDGRGFLGGAGILPGPWLLPSFVRKGRTDLDENALVMRRLIDAFAEMQRQVVATQGLEHVQALDARELLVGRDHRTLWADELHPTPAGFTLVADAFNQAIRDPR
jgi:lysophospholipase L1-like esterase